MKLEGTNWDAPPRHLKVYTLLLFFDFFLMLTCAITMSSYEHTKGKIDVSTCSIVRPFTGELTVVRSEAPVKSIELQLVRVETCGCLEGYAKDVR